MKSWALVIFVLLSSGVSAEARAKKAKAPKAAGNSIFITDHDINAKKSSFAADVRKSQRASIGKAGDGWHLFFVAYLNKAAGADEVSLVFRDPAIVNDNVNAFPFGTRANATIIKGDVQIDPSMGFKTNIKYDVVLARLVDGKEEIYAKGNIELK